MINFNVVPQSRTAIIEAVKIVLKSADGCPQCTLGKLLNELGFQEFEFVAAGILLPCIVATKTTINWTALMMAIEAKRNRPRGEGKLSSYGRELRSATRAEEQVANITLAHSLKAQGFSNEAIGKRMGIKESSVRFLLDSAQLDDANAKSSQPQERPHWLNECLKMGKSGRKSHHFGGTEDEQ